METVATHACLLARHRGAKSLEAKDIALHLGTLFTIHFVMFADFWHIFMTSIAACFVAEHNFDIVLPGFAASSDQSNSDAQRRRDLFSSTNGSSSTDTNPDTNSKRRRFENE